VRKIPDFPVKTGKTTAKQHGDRAFRITHVEGTRKPQTVSGFYRNSGPNQPERIAYNTKSRRKGTKQSNHQSVRSLKKAGLDLKKTRFWPVQMPP
jgi:hypothetical protein